MALSEIYLGNAVAENITKAYLGSTLIFERESFDELVDLVNNVSLLGFYVAKNNYVGANWQDLGTAARDASPISGDTMPSLESWNGKQALSFGDDNILQIAATANNYDIFNSRNTAWIVGEYSAATTTDVETFLSTSTSFALEKRADRTFPSYVQAVGGLLYTRGVNLNNTPVFLLVSAREDVNTRVMVYLNGDFTKYETYTQKSYGDVFIGNGFTGKISNVGVSNGVQKPHQVKKIIQSVNNEYSNLATPSNKQIVFVGDSLTRGFNLTFAQTYPYKLLASLESTLSEIVNYHSDAESGLLFQDYLDNPENVDNLPFAVNHSNRVLIIWLGSNDLRGGGFSAAVTFNKLLDLLQNRIKAGYKKVCLVTVISATDLDGTVKTDFNNLVKNYDYSSLNADIQIYDAGATFTDPTNATYYQVDQIHLNSTGNDLFVSEIQPKIQTLFGLTNKSNITPSVVSATLSSDNTYVDIVFSCGGYKDAEATQLLTFNATGATVTSVKKIDGTTDLTGNDTSVRVFLNTTLDQEFTLYLDAFYSVYGDEIASLTVGSFTPVDPYKDLSFDQGGVGQSSSGNTVTLVDGGGGVGSRSTSFVGSNETVATDEDWEVLFKVSDASLSTGTFGIGVVNAVYNNFVVKLNGATVWRQGSYASSSATIETVSTSTLYRLRYVKADAEIYFDKSTDEGVSWSNIADIRDVNKVLTFPMQVKITADLFAGQGTVVFSNLRGTQNFV